MNHPAEGTLQAFLDGELTHEGAGVALHLRECGRCQAELQALDRANQDLAGALRVLDRPAPVEAARREIARHRGRPAWRVPLGRAAVLLAAVSTALSATLPGSPVRQWIADAWRGGDAPQPVATAVGSTPAPAPAQPQPPGSGAADAAGVSVRPVGGRMRVDLVRPARGLRVVAGLHGGEQVEVSATGAASRARFQTGPGRIEIADAGAGELRIGIPRTAAAFALEVDGRVVLAGNGDSLRVTDERAEILLQVQP